MTTNEQAPTGGERILRGIEFYKAIVDGQAFELIGKAKFEKGADNVS